MIKFTKSAFSFGKSAMNTLKRTLFSNQSLHLDVFRRTRLNFRIKKNEVEFLHEIEHLSIPHLLSSTKLWTFQATKSGNQIDLLRQSLCRIYEHCSEIQTPRDLDHLGQMAMRLFYHLDLPEEALQFYHEFNNEHFDSNKTTMTLMDLLFEQRRYADVLEVYRMRTIERQREPSTLHQTLVYAACYKLNTLESLQYSTDVRHKCNSEVDKAKGRYFEAMLAFNQKKFDLAYRLADDGDNLVSNNIKLLAMAELNDWKGVCDLLYKIKTNRLNGTRYRVSTEVLWKMKESLNLSRPNLSPQEWNRCNRFLLEFAYLGKLILRDSTMDEILCQPIELRPQKKRPTTETLATEKLRTQ